MKKQFLHFISLFTIFLSFLLLVSNCYSQEYGYIEGPQTMCLGECPTYTYINLDPSNPPLEHNWGINNYPTNIPDADTMALCNTGLQNLPAWTWDILLTVVYSDTTLHLVYNIDIVEDVNAEILFSTPEESCPAQLDTIVSGENCQRICVGTSSSYCAFNYDTNEYLQGGWEITGHTDILSEPDDDCIEVEWGEVGFGSINNIGVCGAETTVCVEVLALPEASISSMPEAIDGVITICQGQEIQFESTSEYTTSVLWNFGFATSEEEAPSIIFDIPGTHEISLTAYNECLCSDETTITVEVIDATSPILSCVSTVCVGDVVTYTADMECALYQWNVGSNGNILDGGGNNDDFITIEWTSGSIGDLGLEVTDCSGAICTWPATASIPIIEESAPITGEIKVCKGDLETYALPPYEGTSFNWSLTGEGEIISGQGTYEITVQWSENPTTYNQPQQIDVTYENCFLECGGSSSLIVKISPEHYIAGPLEVCQYDNVSYDAISTENESSILANWSISDGSTTIWSSSTASLAPVIDWSFEPGVYVLKASPASSSSYCSEEYELRVRIAPNPIAPSGIIGDLDVCPQNSYLYEATTSTDDTKFKWLIDDGGSTYEREGNPIVITWTSNGPYEINAIQVSTDGLNCESSPFTIHPSPIENLTINPTSNVCIEETSALSVTYYPNISYTWSIIPSSAGTIIQTQGSASTEIVWHEAGTHTVEVNGCGVIASTTVTVHGNPFPVVNAPDKLCPGTTMEASLAQTYNTYQWKNESGGTVSNIPTVELEAGFYSIVVSNENGCYGSNSFSIESYPGVEAELSSPHKSKQCPAPPFASLYANTSNNGYDYKWTYNGVSIPSASGLSNINVIQYGTYQVSVTDENGCSAVSEPHELIECTIGQCEGGQCTCYAPNYSFDFTQGAVCNEFTFVNTSTAYDPGSVKWNFNDPDSGQSFGAGEMTSHTFSKPGYYIVVLLADYLNTTCYTEQAIAVDAVADFEQNGACPGETISFTDRTTFLPGISITGWEWNFGDPNSPDNISTSQNPNHAFSSSGTYTVSLTITTNGGCTSTTSKEVEVFSLPQPFFTPPIANCEESPIQLSTSPATDIVGVHWNFGDPSSGTKNESDVKSPYHYFDTPQDYTVTLTETDVRGCSNSYNDILTISPNTLSGLISPPGNSTICSGDTIQLVAPIDDAASWLWNTGSLGQEVEIAEAGIYGVNIIGNQGCFYTPPEVIVDILPDPEAISRAIEYDEYNNPIAYYYDYFEICEGEDVYLEAIENAEHTYQWSNGDLGTTTSFTEDKGNLLPIGQHEITLTVTDNNTGCTAVTGIIVEVRGLPQDVLIASSSTGSICEGTTATFTVVSPNSDYDYNWNTGDMGTAIITSASGEYYVTAKNIYGCEAESNYLEILEGPDISKIPSGCHERCNPDTLCLPEIPGIVSYQWFLDGVAIAPPNGNINELVVTESGTYYVEMENTLGCELTSSDLELNLIDPIGDIIGLVYSDVDGDGVISPADTLVPNATINYYDQDGNPLGNIESDTNGAYSFDEIPADTYTMSVDGSNTPFQLIPVWDNVDTTLIGCDSEIVVNWLLEKQCEDGTYNIELGFCEGDSLIHNGITYYDNTVLTENHLSFYGCDSTNNTMIQMYPNTIEDLTVSACYGEQYQYNDEWLDAGFQGSFLFVSSHGCDSTIHLTVAESAPIGLTIETEESCIDQGNGSIHLYTDGGNGEYMYYMDGIPSTVPVFHNLDEGEYEITIIDEEGCETTEMATIALFPKLEFEIEGGIYSCANQEGQLLVNIVSGDDGNIITNWSNGISTMWNDIPTYGLYTVDVSNHCEQVHQQIYVQPDEEIMDDVFYIPNAFTPNGDGVNDVFLPLANVSTEIYDFSMQIYDRWGGLVFETDNVHQGWNGKCTTDKMDETVYVWVVTATVNVCGKQQTIERAGDVVLLR